ncbi:MAG: outer membrane lipoprotein carrier protein LolA [Bacilli bacterium]|nr:outer membrane lipoprotein carrier protein LolA [Bacilli bacterium]
MKKILLMLITLCLLTGCGKVDKDKLVQQFVDDVESAKAYTLSASMEIYSSEDTFTYDLNVSYMDDDYFKVNMLNKVNDHQQIILRNDEAVYVVTPSLNKSYKFSSEWPYNSSQSYILNSLVKDIESTEDIIFVEEEDGYSLKVNVDYPNNDELSYEKLYFDKDMNLKQVITYDKDDIACIKVVFNDIDYKANLGEDDFNVDNMVSENCCDTEESESTGSLEDIIYPLYIPTNTYLKDKETISTENGERVILTFNGEKNFVLIEENAVVNSEFEVVPVYGDPLLLNNGMGALTTNALSWTYDNVDYYLASSDLSTSEMLTIAESLSVVNLVEK